MRQLFHAMAISFAIILLAGMAWSYPGSYMGKRTGAPGETSCNSCHSGAVNSGSGSVGLSAPVEYMPDETVDLTVSLANAGMVRWGFQITALDASDQPVGQFVISDATNTQLRTDTRQYVFQTKNGSYKGTADVSPGWSLQWIAPAQGAGAVTFWLSGLAANDGQGTGGDSVYTTSRTVTEAVGTSVGDQTGSTLPAGFALSQNYPNPFNPATSIQYDVPAPVRVTISIYNILGKRVRTLVDELKVAGSYTVNWDATDSEGRRVSSGMYFYRFQAGTVTATRQMVLLR